MKQYNTDVNAVLTPTQLKLLTTATNNSALIATNEQMLSVGLAMCIKYISGENRIGQASKYLITRLAELMGVTEQEALNSTVAWIHFRSTKPTIH